jgi:hypothetical protein
MPPDPEALPPLPVPCAPPDPVFPPLLVAPPPAPPS